MEAFPRKKQLHEFEACDLSRKVVETYKLGFDESHHLTIMPGPKVDLQARIDAAAAHVQSLGEICASLPGDTPAQQLQSALDSGLIPAAPEGDAVTDLTEIPETINDFANAGLEARVAVNRPGDFKNMLKSILLEIQKESEAKAAKPAEAQEGDKE